ncbi:hypothetical protein ACFSTC_08030 [Nonomuraea ferruginea]
MSRPSRSASARTCTSAGRSGGAGPGGGEHADAAVAERPQVLQRERDAAPVVEDDLGGGAAQRVADRDHRQRRAQLGPERRGGIERLHDEAVDALVTQLAERAPARARGRRRRRG